MSAQRLRILLWMLPLLGLVVGLILFFRPQPVEVDIERVVRKKLQVSVFDDGMTRIRERYVVSSPLAGNLQRISFEVGDSVVAGQTELARLQATDPALLDPRAVAQAQARVSAALQGLEVAKAEQAKAEAVLGFVEQDLGRVRRLYDTRAASESAVKEAEYIFQSRLEETRAATFRVEMAQYEWELEKAALLLTEPPASDSNPAEKTENEGMFLPIVSPITWRILRIYQESSTVVTPGTNLLEVGDPSDLEIVVDVLSQDAVRVHPGDPVSLLNWGGSTPLEGRVRRVEPAGFTKVSALGVEEQRVNVIIDFVEPIDQRHGLGDHFRIDAEIIVWEEEQCLVVPTSALFRIEADWYVFTLSDSIVRQTRVEIGRDNGTFAQLLAGLDENQVVIVYPGDKVADGMAARPR